MITILGSIINICFYETFSNPSSNESNCASLLIRHSVYLLIKALVLLFEIYTLSFQTQVSLLGHLITFVNNFHFNLVIMFVYFVNQSSVINLICSEKHYFIIVAQNTIGKLDHFHQEFYFIWFLGQLLK